MLSKYKLTRQIPLTTTYYSADQVIANAGILAFAFYPQSGQGLYANGNSSKGYMASGDTDYLLGGNLLASIREQCYRFGQNCILRDMGKTVYTAYLTAQVSPPSSKAYFRQVQLLSPTALGINGWNGGPNGSTFGVTGYPRDVADFYVDPRQNTTSYLTFYIPVTIANIVAPESTLTGAYAIEGGQM